MATRSRKSAKTAGTAMETAQAGYLAKVLGLLIERRARNGAKDRGDLSGVLDSYGRRIVVEIKDYGGRLLPSEWLRETEVERANDEAHAGIVIAKRRGTTDPGRQYVLMDVDTLVRLLRGPTPMEA